MREASGRLALRAESATASRRFPRLLIGAAVLVLLGGCGREPPAAEPSRPVMTIVLGRTAGDEVLSFSGEVRSRYETPLAFRISGKIAARLVDAGAAVRPGDVLARLDPADTALSVAAADAQLELAAADAQRFRNLRERNFVSQAALDAKEMAYKAARAQADLARNQSAYTVLKAEQAGVIGLISAEVGQVVAAGQTVMRLARADTLEVAIAIPEARMPEVRELGVAEVGLWADETVSYSGMLREVSPVADPVTRTYAARVSIREADSKVLLGMTATVRFVRRNGSQRLVVPLTALFQHDGKPAVWVVRDEQSVVLRPVVVARYREDTALVDDGVEAGERIVVAGVHKLSEGERIRVLTIAPAHQPGASGRTAAGGGREAGGR
ncbi:efflux RND transporter periplasmic adaptor subunit [Accumulibacter sp.]|uniref:efflux RND transporter periplasmic adaptor subunit n=1 Tax=Accumulibacter sp. TaxID=2053492 RepID=UPI0025E273C9|nr:efflux RND transporter periplasmic adaptor subunit [Accumulibacter sp.]MCM8596529.1 efflux RND transporter periplasmic adaptor subunit [Accumulibacter sp.]MCM8626938.1 efflux RND transporter periplasmic adaptor subunit [Accumulibacter sp.]MDS4050677.1 efflux RND transporter periplasmic adaptor subunit [Accumulibacter sp.]